MREHVAGRSSPEGYHIDRQLQAPMSQAFDEITGFVWMVVEYIVGDKLIAHTYPISPPVVRAVHNEGIPAGRPCVERRC